MKLNGLFGLALALLLALPAGRGAAAPTLEQDSADAGALFDGESVRAGSPAAAGAVPQDKAALLAALKTRVQFEDRGDPAEARRLEEILARVLDSPTGRRLAGEFLQEGARAKISFEAVPDTEIFELNGKKTFWTSSGHAHTDGKPPAVHLNEAYLQADQHRAPETMAHELFGHVLERKRAERYGVQDTYLFHQNEEANAGLVGWTVSAELGNKIENSWAWIYMNNPEDYHRRLKSNMAYYAGTLSTEEMRDPLPAYQKRYEEAGKMLERLPVKKTQNELYLKIVDHFTAAHKIAAEAFATLVERVNATIKSIPGTVARLNEIREYLSDLMKRCVSTAGRAWVDELREQSDNRYFEERARVMDERAEVLGRLMIGRTWESEQPPSRPGQITMPEFESMWKKEQASSCGWRP